mgnify:CR=1 FL=1
MSFSYEELMACGFKLIPANAVYEYEPEYGVWASRADDEAFMRSLVEGGEDLRIVGIVQPKEDVDATSLVTGIYYTPELIFVSDNNIAYGVHIAQVLAETMKETEKHERPDEAES